MLSAIQPFLHLDNSCVSRPKISNSNENEDKRANKINKNEWKWHNLKSHIIWCMRACVCVCVIRVHLSGKHSTEKFVTHYVVSQLLALRRSEFHLLFRSDWWSLNEFFMWYNESFLFFIVSWRVRCVPRAPAIDVFIWNEKLIFLLWKLLFY